MTDYKKIAQKLFPKVKISPEEIEKKYPPRNLPPLASVTRVAPSPTGFMHIGGVFSALVSERLAHQNKGVFFLRIEDTDRKREMTGAVEVIVNSLKNYGIYPDEGEIEIGKEVGAYGPYRQSARGDIYAVYAKKLVEEGKAYPAFDTEEELEKMTNTQREQKIRPGYRGEWAVWREKDEEEILSALEKGKPFVVRLKSEGDFEKKIKCTDMIRGERELSENDIDSVILKADGMPTYHFAHVVDDYLMRTTDVLRADEWLASLTLHLELWKKLGWNAPRYGHFAPIQKMDDGSRRKLSKRKDPEANILFYEEAGYPSLAVVEYLLNLANSSFEDWRKANPNEDYKKFPFSVKKMNVSGALFDANKLGDISKNIIYKMSAKEVLEKSLEWTKKYDKELFDHLNYDHKFAEAIFAIERGGEQGRKDIVKWSDLREEVSYFFDEIFEKTPIDDKMFSPVSFEDVRLAVSGFISNYDEKDSKDVWFDKIKKLAVSLGFAESVKAFKLEPKKYKGNVGDIAKVFRVILTGKTKTPDLYQIMQVMGKERVIGRLKGF